VLGGCGTCGGEGQSCCEDSSNSRAPDFCTGAGLACYSSKCQTCGAPGEPCCQGNACAGLGCCVSGKCVAAGSNCGTSSSGVCDSGSCRSASGSCGGLGEPYCGSDCTTQFAYDYSSTCEPCGGENQQCCNGYYGFCAQGYGCDFDNCVRCGLSGQPCCQGGFCTTGTCNGGECP
jgi:hypothetical protein